MSQELVKKGDIQVEGDPRSQLELDMIKEREQMKAVRQQAIQLIIDHPDRFNVIIIRDDNMRELQVETQFTVDFEEGPEQLKLFLGMTSWKDGRLENGVNIRPIGKHYFVDGAISYRLDIVQVIQTEEELQRLRKIATSPATTDAEEQVREAMRGMIARMFEIGDDGQASNIYDNRSETTIKAGDALKILQNARDLERPRNMLGYTGLSLKEFQKYLKKQAEENGPQKTPKLLG